MQRVLIPAVSTIAAFLMLIAGLISPFILFFSLGPGPCAEQGWLMIFVKALVPFALLFSAVILERLKWKPKLQPFLIAIALPSIVLLLNWQMLKWEAAAEKKCRERTLAEAAIACRADLSLYQTRTDKYGGNILTLVPPGTADESWTCLGRWARYNSSVSLEIDPTVYDQHVME